MKYHMQERKHNPNLEGYRKCYHCNRLYDETADHVCYEINRIKDWKQPKKGRKIHTPLDDLHGNDFPMSDN